MANRCPRARNQSTANPAVGYRSRPRSPAYQAVRAIRIRARRARSNGHNEYEPVVRSSVSPASWIWAAANSSAAALASGAVPADSVMMVVV